MESKPRQGDGDREDAHDERESDALEQLLMKPRRPASDGKRGGTGVGRDLDH